MQERFESLWQRLGADNAPDANAVTQAWRTKGRYYHDETHLQHVIDMLDWSRTALEKTGEVTHLSPGEKQNLFDTVELALWYHDIIYDPTAKDNEAQSRDMFLAHAAAAGLPESIQHKVAALIDLTAAHTSASSLMENLMVDCDLAVLGADKDTFQKYDDNIRKEYAFVPADIYAQHRAAVMQHFLDSKPVFKTKAFQNAFNASAERNLKDCIRRHKAQTATPPQP